MKLISSLTTSAWFVGGLGLGCLVLAMSVPAQLYAQSPDCAWQSGFHRPYPSDDVKALAVFDDGGGDALYAGGEFKLLEDVIANFVARWDGSGWSKVGLGFNRQVDALAVFNDGGGDALYAAGNFTKISGSGGGAANYVAKWDGSSWTALGSGLDGRVYALAVYDDGGGEDLYVGGDFTMAGGGGASNIARWDGSTWTALGTGVDAPVRSLAVYNDGGGARLYVGGEFTTAGGMSADYIARWNGTTWATVGTGAGNVVRALTVYDDGGGAELYAGGDFIAAGGTAANRVASWNGTTWSALGVTAGGGVNASVHSLAVYNDGGGDELYVGGDFTMVDGAATVRIASWNGTAWSALGTGTTDAVLAMISFDDGGGADLIAGGAFSLAGGASHRRIASWNGTSWAGLHGPIDAEAPEDKVLAFATYDDGGGEALYAGGWFTSVGDVPANYVARWSGTAWTALGVGVASAGGDTSVNALTVYDDGGGEELIVGGVFNTAGGSAANNIAAWDGTSWSTLGSGVNGSVLAMAVYDDGGGPALYVGGGFSMAGGMAASGIAKWDGTSWSPVGLGVNGVVWALAVYDDGNGAELYAGGGFTQAGGMNAGLIARWNGSSWNSLPNDLDFASQAAVRALQVWDDGGGEQLYVGGRFTTGDAVASHIAAWNGASWSSLGDVADPYGFDPLRVNALTVFDYGSGSMLIAGGDFNSVGGASGTAEPAQAVAAWDGSGWSDVQTGMNALVWALGTFDDGTGPSLYAGGEFTITGAVSSYFMARYACPNLIFTDGFESGDLSRWSGIFPP